VFVQCTALVHLDLVYNEIEDTGAESLTRVLGQYLALAYLDLTNNWIKPEGIKNVEKALHEGVLFKIIDDMD